jgi:hypothetical protein
MAVAASGHGDGLNQTLKDSFDRIALARELQRRKGEAPVVLRPGLCLMRRHASLCCGFLVELSPHHGTSSTYTLPKKNQGLLVSDNGSI